MTDIILFFSKTLLQSVSKSIFCILVILIVSFVVIPVLRIIIIIVVIFISVWFLQGNKPNSLRESDGS